MSNARQELQPWFEARRRFRLSHAEVQMARELGLNPGKFGQLANHHQEPWKAPLPVFIADLYRKRFGKDRPDEVRTLEQTIAARERKAAEKRVRKQERRAARAQASAGAEPGTGGTEGGIPRAEAQ